MATEETVPANLASVLARARGIAAQFAEPEVGRRSLVLAAASCYPELFVAAVHRHGLNPRGVALALGEWWPRHVSAAAAPALSLTVEASAALVGINSVEGLLDQLLRSTPRETNDRTAMVLCACGVL